MTWVDSQTTGASLTVSKCHQKQHQKHLLFISCSWILTNALSLFLMCLHKHSFISHEYTACTAERFFRVDRAQEHLHYVVDICNDDLYILDAGETDVCPPFAPEGTPFSHFIEKETRERDVTGATATRDNLSRSTSSCSPTEGLPLTSSSSLIGEAAAVGREFIQSQCVNSQTPIDSLSKKFSSKSNGSPSAPSTPSFVQSCKDQNTNNNNTTTTTDS